MICFKYLRHSAPDVELEWCTPSNDPQPPPDDPPEPPPGWPLGWGDEPGFQVFPTGSGEPCCYAGFHSGAAFDEDIGTWGGWTWTLTDEECPDVIVEVLPVAWEGDVVFWQLRSYPGNEPNVLGTTTEVEGEWPIFDFGIGDWTPCPESQGILITFG